MEDNILDVLYEQIELIKVSPMTMTVEELRIALTKRYDLQLQIVLQKRAIMETEKKKEKDILKKEISLLKGFSRSVANEGRSYNRLASKNPVFSEQEIMSEEEAMDLIEKGKIFEDCSQLFLNTAKEKQEELLKEDKVAEFLNNQRSIAVSKMVLSDYRRDIKNNKVDSPLEQMSQIVLEEESIVDATAKNITIVGLSDRVVEIYKLLRYKQLANRYGKEKYTINRDNTLRTHSNNSDLLIEAYSKVENGFRKKAKVIECKTKKKANKLD